MLSTMMMIMKSLSINYFHEFLTFMILIQRRCMLEMITMKEYGLMICKSVLEQLRRLVFFTFLYFDVS